MSVDPRDLMGAAILGAFFLLVLAAAELWARKGNPKPESTRKFVHLLGGVGCLFFPVLIESPWIVLGMALLLSGSFALGSTLGGLKSLHRVTRKTRGSEYYPIAIFVVFVLADGRLWLYLSSVLVLIVADAMASLIGGRYGRIRYRVEEDQKSLEGSLVFFGFAFVAIWVPLHFVSDLPLDKALLSSLIVSLLVTGFEAISLRGTDNLFVPLAVSVILLKITTKDVGEIFYQNLSFIGICCVIGLSSWRIRSFNVGGAVALMLFAYAGWSLGSEWWGLPAILALTAFLIFRLLVRSAADRTPRLRVRILSQALIPSIAVLIAANVWDIYGRLYGSYLASLVIVLTIGGWDQIQRFRENPKRLPRALVLGLGAAAWLVVAALPWLLQHGLSGWKTPVLIGSVCLPIALLHTITVRKSLLPDEEASWAATDFLLTCASAGVVFVAENGVRIS